MTTGYFLKRPLDVLFSLLGCLFLLPLSIFIKLAYVLTGDSHSIFYTQTRLGKNAKPFLIYKYRTMRPTAEYELSKLLKDKSFSKEWKSSQKIADDPRITKIGKILRRTSLDEFPQFFNVLKGQMSIIGPRPLVPGELDSHQGNPKLYYSVRPGITGWWATNGRSATSYKKRLELEYFYIKNQSFFLDLRCFGRTFLAIFAKTGAK